MTTFCRLVAEFAGVRTVALLAAVLVLACTPQEEDSGTDEPSGPVPEVNLPPVPNIDIERPVIHEDGALTVWGLVDGIQQYLGQTVTVTGYLRHVYVCENREAQDARDLLIMRGELDEADEEVQAILERCNYPHLYLVDHLNAEHELLVTGYAAELELRLLVGQRYTASGRFVEETRGFRRAGTGLLYATGFSGGNLDEEPPPVPQ